MYNLWFYSIGVCPPFHPFLSVDLPPLPSSSLSSPPRHRSCSSSFPPTMFFPSYDVLSPITDISPCPHWCPFHLRPPGEDNVLADISYTRLSFSFGFFYSNINCLYQSSGRCVPIAKWTIIFTSRITSFVYVTHKFLCININKKFDVVLLQFILLSLAYFHLLEASAPPMSHHWALTFSR